MAKRETAAVKLGEQGLDVAEDGFACRGVAGVPDRRFALQPGDDVAMREIVPDEAHAPFGVKAPAVIADDARRLLAAMLERMQAERGDRGGVGMAENAEDAAFFAQRLAVVLLAARDVCAGRWGRGHRGLPRGAQTRRSHGR